MISKFIVLLLVAHAAFGRTAGTSAQNSLHETPRSEGTSYVSDLRYMYKVYQECAATDVMSCLKVKLVSALDRAAKSYTELPLFEGVKFVKDPQAPAPAEVKTEAELEATLPRSLEDKDTALDNIIVDRVSNFLGSHTLQIKLPSASDTARSLEEARGKKKKGGGGGLLLLPLILGGTLIPLALGALALLAGKALIVSKLALVLAGIIGLKKLLSGGGGGGHDAGHVEVYSAGHSGWGRSYNKEDKDAKDDAQNLAYAAYAPKTS